MKTTYYTLHVLTRIIRDGFEPLAFLCALDAYEQNPTQENEDRLGLSHPSNWLTEKEAESSLQDELLDILYSPIKPQ
jgi:hypothetical protein